MEKTITIEASALRLKPGDWPETIDYLGNVFNLRSFETSEGALNIANYRSHDKRTWLKVFND